jgi:hypothetical protein
MNVVFLLTPWNNKPQKPQILLSVKQIKTTPHTMYHLDSLEKVYAATAIMIFAGTGVKISRF